VLVIGIGVRCCQARRRRQLGGGAKTLATRRLILRANAIYLGIASVLGLIGLDVRGIFLGSGPEGRILAGAPYAGVGFLESHGLALILSVLLWRAAPTRSWHITGAATTALLGTANLLCWQIFVAANILPMGYLTTGLHGTFALAQLAAAIAAPSERPPRV